MLITTQGYGSIPSIAQRVEQPKAEIDANHV